MFDLKQYPLTFAGDALEPYMSARTVDFHYNKHMAAYIKNLNGFIEGTEWSGKGLDEIIAKTAGNPTTSGIFNNAAQVFNHAFFFATLRKDSGTAFPAALNDAFGGFDKFAAEFKEAAVGVFGSGWAWLIHEDGQYKITKGLNADNPIAHGAAPILCLDVWEHAYYLDYQNRRGDFADAFLNHLVDWNIVEKRIAAIT
ncbi:MAG: superoxide dismutase [Alphaproteobacteria bacterium]|nr:superoxide dismutase [Alphaproteobacteria bacterium]